ncbi:MAG: TAXI family TRAP transporter solute-binding subunit [bacterium]
MKRKIFIVAALLALVLRASFAQGERRILITTGSSSGTYFPLGAAFVELINEKLPNVRANVRLSNGSVENVEWVALGKANFGIAQNDIANYAYEGTGKFQGKRMRNLRGIATLYSEVVQIVVGAESNLFTVNDLQGKRVSLGPQGSGTAVNAEQILKAAGIFDKVQKEYLTFDESVKALIGEKLDAAFLTAGTPTTAVAKIAKRFPVRLLKVGDEIAKRLQSDYPFYVKVKVPAGTYRGMSRDAETVGIRAVLITNKHVDPDLVYDITKLIFENTGRLGRIHPKGNDIKVREALDGMTIPLHEGAQKYYDER